MNAARRTAASVTEPADGAAAAASPGSDRPAKLDRLRAVLRARAAEALVLTSPEMMAWLLDGARTQVPPNGPSVMAAAITADDEQLVCAHNEIGRMAAEELPGGTTPEPVPWFEPLTGGLPVPDGTAVLAEADVVDELRAARASLLPLELARYRSLCRDAATVVTDVVSAARPDHTERQVASALAAGLVAVGAEPLVLLVGGGRRLLHRHPLPTHAPVGDRFLAVVCARRHGMIANLSRWRSFDAGFRDEAGRENPGDTVDAARRLFEVEADALDATRAGASLADVFAALRRAYAAHGFDPDEWTCHHQGGPTGYLGRDPKVSHTSTGSVVAGQAFAWNPSAPGVKVEDTVLTGPAPDGATPDGPAIPDPAGMEVLTVDPRWPTVSVRGRPRPLILHG